MIREGQSTFTFNRVQKIVHDALIEVDSGSPGPKWRETWLTIRETSVEDIPGSDIHFYGPQKRRERAKAWCKAYTDECMEPETHLEQIDNVYGELVKCGFHPDQAGGTSAVVENARSLLRRLPATPAPLNSCADVLLTSNLHSKYFLPDTVRSWDSLKVVNFVDSNVIRIALRMVSEENGLPIGQLTAPLANTIFELLRTALESLPESEQKIIVVAFLWTSWHRILMLHFHNFMRFHLRYGSDCLSNKYLSVEGASFLRQTTMQTYSLPQGVRYMCRWAFQMLYRDRAAICMDFRSFHERFAQLFQASPSRCVISEGRAEQCKGDSPFNCMRFKGMNIENQSAHSRSCLGQQSCKRLLWNEGSYRKHSGARAVSLSKTDDISIHYCEFTERTMAISHVWSHGQGGRPESITTPTINQYRGGFNQCLHIRYKSIAQSFDCDSYWMDTPCIPEDHELRREAIRNINHVFADSKLTLICDKDIMQIDASNLTLEVQESILATLLVCDWNVRAWTLLEAVRGRKNIHLLCRNEVVVCLKDILGYVTAHGSIAITNLFLSAQHLLPQMKRTGESMERYSRGLVPLEEAAYVLRHRCASRPGDDIVIWSLLCDEKPCYTASELWHTQIQLSERDSRGDPPRGCVRSGFLLSSNQRMQQRGLTWAPSRPGIPEDCYHQGSEKLFFPEDGALSAAGFFSKEGLTAYWYIVEFPGGRIPRLEAYSKFLHSLLSSTSYILRQIRVRFLKDYRWGAIIRPVREFDNWGESENEIIQNRNDVNGLLVAVLGSNDKEEWTWKGIYEWKEANLSYFPAQMEKMKKILIV